VVWLKVGEGGEERKTRRDCARTRGVAESESGGGEPAREWRTANELAVCCGARPMEVDGHACSPERRRMIGRCDLAILKM
jgi:hypothetical protein